MHLLTDAELLTSVAGGDVVAVGGLYDRHASTLFPVALRILRDRSEAEDVLHDVFVLVSERAHEYRPERGSVIAWLVMLVRNRSVDRARSHKRRGTIARDVLAHEPQAPARDPEGLTVDAIIHDTLRRALLGVPPAQRQTLEIAFFEGLSYSEIAARENVPLGTVKARASRALAALREALATTDLAA